MLGQGWFIDENKSLVHESEIGISPESMGRRAAGSPITRPTTSYRQPLRRIGGNPNGTWESIKTWWSKLPTWQKGTLIGIPVVAGVAIAASQKSGGKGSSVKRI